MSELKSCPFCGAFVTTEVYVSRMGAGESIIEFSVVCSHCGTRKTATLKIQNTAVFMDVEKAMEKAVEIWNARANE